MASFAYDRDLWVRYLEENGYYDDIPIDLEDFLENTNKSARELLNMFYFGRSWLPHKAEAARERRRIPKEPADPNDDLVAFDGYGNVITIRGDDLDRYLMECTDLEDVKKWAVDEGLFEE